MKFTILSHAGVMIEHQGVSVLCDPWLIGSCYWRSWWNFPEPSRSLIDSLKPDYIYISHIHWDHFQGPSIRLFPNTTPILTPKFPSSRIADDLRDMGCADVREIPHGSCVSLSQNFSMYCYHFGLESDSTAAFTDGKTSILNVNDCKIFGLPLQQIRKQFPNPDFVLRSHSNARVLPHCLENYQQYPLNFRQKKDYIEQFSNFCLSMNTKYAIPFASNHCFLHRETERFNDTSVRPVEISDYYTRRANEIGIASKLTVMPPGSTWEDSTGFKIEEFDYDKGAEYIASLKEKYSEKLNRYYAWEEGQVFDEIKFQQDFKEFLTALPFPLRRMGKIKVTFKITDKNGEQYWEIDFCKKTVKKVDPNTPFEILIESQASVMNDCVNGFFAVWGASKRLRIHISDQKYLRNVQLFLSLRTYYDMEVFPLRKNFKIRAIGSGIRRWREGFEFLKMILKHKLLKQPLRISDLYAPPSVKRCQDYDDKGSSQAKCEGCWFGCTLEENSPKNSDIVTLDS